MKTCSKCKQELADDHFYKHKKYGLQAWCKKCSHERRSQYYQDNKETELERNKKTRDRYNQRFTDYKKTLSCRSCGETRWYVLDFHHPDDTGKVDNVGSMIAAQRAWKDVIKEIKKCEVLCANCHRELHYFERMEA